MQNHAVYVFVDRAQEIKVVNGEGCKALLDDPQWMHVGSLAAESWIAYTLRNNPHLMVSMCPDWLGEKEKS